MATLVYTCNTLAGLQHCNPLHFCNHMASVNLSSCLWLTPPPLLVQPVVATVLTFKPKRLTPTKRPLCLGHRVLLGHIIALIWSYLSQQYTYVTKFWAKHKNKKKRVIGKWKISLNRSHRMMYIYIYIYKPFTWRPIPLLWDLPHVKEWILAGDTQ